MEAAELRPSPPEVTGSVLAMRLRDRWREMPLVRACSVGNPFLVHEFNLIRRDLNFWRMNAILLLAFWLFFFQAPWLMKHIGVWVMQEGFPVLTLALCWMLLVFRLRRPHIRYDGENAVFLCLLPISGAELVLDQIVAVLFQPALLLVLALPLSILLTSVGMVSAPALMLKMGIVMGILILVAVYGVTRVSRQWQLFLGLPLLIVILPMVVGLISSTVVQVLFDLVMLLVPGVDETQLMQVLAVAFTSILTILALPILLLAALLNPILSYLTQATDAVAAWTAKDPTGGLLTQPFAFIFNIANMVGQSGGGRQLSYAATLTRAASAIDQGYHLLILSRWHLLFAVTLHSLYLRDAWVRGADQFEYFRVRGYPEHPREMRLQERNRIRSRNMRQLSQRYWHWGEVIRGRIAHPGLATLTKRLLVFFTAPTRQRLALKAMELHPVDFEHWQQEQWATRAAARKSRVRRSARESRQAVPPSAPPVVTHPDHATTPRSEVPEAPASAPITSAPAPMPAAVHPGAAAIRIPAAAPVTSPDATSPPSAAARALQSMARLPFQLFGGVARFILQLMPAALRANPVFARDMRFVRQILGGQREGIWSYSWTVLLTIFVLIAVFVYVLACMGTAFINLATIASLKRFPAAGQVDLTWPGEYLVNFIKVMFWVCPLVYLALPIYSYLKERGRSDWQIYVLTTQSGANMLIGKVQLFLVIGAIVVLTLPVVAFIFNPMLWGGPILSAAFGSRAIEWELFWVSPIDYLLFGLLLLGLCACFYEAIQVVYFGALCFNWKRSGAAVGTLVVFALGAMFIVTLQVLSMTGIDLLEPFRDNATFLALKVFFELIWEGVVFFLGTVYGHLATLSAGAMPITPWQLDNWYWREFQIRADRSIPSLERGVHILQALLAAGLYWGLALIGHWISSQIFEHRLRGEAPRYWSLQWRPRRRKQRLQRAEAPAPVV